MSKVTFKVPEKLYVTFVQRGQDERLGFLSPYEKNSGFAARKKTQDRWAYGTGNPPQFAIQDDESIVSIGGDATKAFTANCFPRIFKNEPLQGFAIRKTIHRSESWANQSVVWRVYDPRGFELEIKSGNMMQLLDYCVMDHGEIKGKCCWGREGGDNILLPEESDIFKQAMEYTSKLNSKITVKDVEPGDEVEVAHPDYVGKQLIYLGKYYIYDCYKSTTEDQYNKDIRFNPYGGQSKPRHFFKLEDGTIALFSNPNIGLIRQKKRELINQTAGLKQIMDILNKNNHNLFHGIEKTHIIFVYPKKIDPTLIRQSFGEITGKEIIERSEEVGTAWYSVAFFCDYNGSFYKATIPHQYGYGGKRQYKLSLCDRETLFTAGMVKYLMEGTNRYRPIYGYGSDKRNIDIDITEEEFANLKFTSWHFRYKELHRDFIDMRYN